MGGGGRVGGVACHLPRSKQIPTSLCFLSKVLTDLRHFLPLSVLFGWSMD